MTSHKLKNRAPSLLGSNKRGEITESLAALLMAAKEILALLPLKNSGLGYLSALLARSSECVVQIRSI